MLAVGQPVHVEKLHPDGSVDYQWDGQVLRCDTNGVVLRAEFNVDVVEREFVTLRRGDVFIEFYYFDPSSSDTRNPRGAGVVGGATRGASDVEPAESAAQVRYYNVFQISSPDGALKGWYCNLGLPAQLGPESQVLSYVDLALDVWVNADGTFVVLDEDELEHILDQHPELRQVAQKGRADLLNLVQSRRLPRWPD